MAETPRAGRYKNQRAKGRKVVGLTKKEVAKGRRVGKAGRASITKKESKAAYKNKDIGETKWVKASERTGPRAKGGIVVDKTTGKPITGTVKLPSGKTATYVRGKRVTYKAKPTGRGRGGSGGGGGGGGTTTTSRTGQSSSAANKWTKKQIDAYKNQGKTPRPKGDKSAVSGTVASAIAQGKAAGSGTGKTKKVWLRGQYVTLHWNPQTKKWQVGKYAPKKPPTRPRGVYGTYR